MYCGEDMVGDGGYGTWDVGRLDSEYRNLKNENAVLKQKIKDAENCLVCCAIADPIEVCENTLAILEE